MNRLLAELLLSEDRKAASHDLSTILGVEDLLIFLPDPDIGLLLPAPGYPQMLKEGRRWRDFLKDIGEKDVTSAELPSPYTGNLVRARAVSGQGGIVLVLLGGEPEERLLRELASPLSLAGQSLVKEQKLRLVDAQLQQMQGEIRSARVLTTVLDQLRRELEAALSTASRETAIAEAAKKELLKTNEELAIARDQALAASHSKGAFLANMSHELRTPLTAIIGYSELLQDDITEASALQDLQRIQDSGQHLLTLVNDILDMAKIEAGYVELHPETFLAEEVVNEAVEIITPQMAIGHNSCVLHTAPDIPPLFTDRNKLRQILLNLLSNAAKFTEGGTVSVTTTYDAAEEMVVFSVKDTGIGISAEAIPRLFREFSQLDDSATKTVPGTGLGLAISKRLCQLFGGQITVESKLGEGSTFRVLMPPRILKEKLKLSSPGNAGILPARDPADTQPVIARQ